MIDTYCLYAFKFNPTKGDIDVISDQLVNELLNHQEIYMNRCK